MSYTSDNETKWDLHNWFCQIAFFIVIALMFFYSVISETHSDTAWWYFLYGSVPLIIIASVGAALPIPLAKNIISMATIMANVFIIPLVLFTSGYDLGLSAGFSLVYVIIIGAISPYIVAVGTGIAALALCSYLHFENNVFKSIPDFKQDIITERVIQDGENAYTIEVDEPIYYRVEKEETNLKELSLKHYKSEDYYMEIYEENKEKLGTETPNDIKIMRDTELLIPNIKLFNYKSPLLISGLYMLAVLLGIGWKIYVIKMFEISRSALNNNSSIAENEILNLKDELEQSENNCRLLKEEVAIQIIEMNQISGLKKDT